MKNSIIGFVLFSLFIFSGCVFEPEKEEEKISDTKRESLQESQESIGNTFDYILSNIKPGYINEQGFQQCVEKSLHTCLTKTVEQQVVLQKNPELCHDIILEENKINCQRVYVTQLAKQENNRDFCKSIIDDYSRGFCEIEFIIQDSVENESVEECSTLGGLESRCVSSVVSLLLSKDSNAKWCDLFDNDQQQQNCKKDFLLRNTQELDIDLESLTPME